MFWPGIGRASDVDVAVGSALMVVIAGTVALVPGVGSTVGRPGCVRDARMVKEEVTAGTGVP